MSQQPDSLVQDIGHRGRSAGPTEVTPSLLAGFWRRVAAFFVDCLVLGVVGVIAGLFLADQFAALGAWGRLLGFCIAWVYFGLLESRLNAGQSFGKRILRIKVVGRDGQALSIPRAFLRFLPVGLPWFLNNAQWPATWSTSPVAYALSVVIIGLGSCVLYLLIFNRATRQSVQDLLVDSYVVLERDDHAVPVNAGPLWKVHLAVCGLLVIGSVIVPHVVQRAASGSLFSPLLKTYTAVNDVDWVGHAQVSKGHIFVASVNGGAASSSSLNIVAYVKDSNIDDTDRATQLARLALSADPTAREVDVIAVDLVYGYDIGIASSWRSHNTAHAPADWSPR